MEIRQLVTFIRASQFQSFSKAAESLGYSQSAVTVQIRALEDELGVRLFDRLGKRVVLTGQGENFLQNAKRILDEVYNAQQSIKNNGELTGTLHIGTLESLCFYRLPPLLQQFRAAHPKVSVRVCTGSPEEMIEKMERGDVDLICILDEPRDSANWHKCVEVPEEVVFVCSPGLPLPHQGALCVSELLDKPFFLTEKNANYRRRFDRFLAAHDIELSPSLEISDTSFIIKMLESNQGVSLLPKFAVEEGIREGKLQRLEVSDFRVTMYRQVLYRILRFMSLSLMFRLLQRQTVTSSSVYSATTQRLLKNTSALLQTARLSLSRTISVCSPQAQKSLLRIPQVQ